MVTIPSGNNACQAFVTNFKLTFDEWTISWPQTMVVPPIPSACTINSWPDMPKVWPKRPCAIPMHGGPRVTKKRGGGSDRRHQAPPSVVVAISRSFVPSFTFSPMFVSFMSLLYLLQVVSIPPPPENRYNAPRLSHSFPIPPNSSSRYPHTLLRFLYLQTFPDVLFSSSMSAQLQQFFGRVYYHAVFQDATLYVAYFHDMFSFQ
jgi:hypothetical protein